MPDVSIEFHAAPEENREFVKQVVSEFRLHIIEIRFPPYEAVELDPTRLDEPWNLFRPL
jgi:hypothetical protein